MLPREKFQEMGIDSLSEEELVSILIGSGVKGVCFSKLAKKILKILKEGNISYEEMIKIKGLGNVKTIQIISAIELGRRIYDFRNKDIIVSNSQLAFNELKYLVQKKQEYLVCLFLNARYELLSKKTIAIGTVDSLSISSRDIIISALNFNSVYVIIGHNHPSGVSKPSDEDIAITERIKSSLDLVGIKLLDHLVVASDGWRSVC